MTEAKRGSLIRIVLAFFVLSAGVAQGDKLPEGMRLELGTGALANCLVVRSGVRGVVPLPEGGISAIDNVRYDATARQVTILYQTRCGGAAKVVMPLTVLEARIENSNGLLALGQHHYAAADASFERAAALDGELAVARTNLASARMRAGDRQGALRALTPLVADASAWLYSKTLSDADLAPLVDAPAIAALRAPQPGSARIDANALTGGWPARVRGGFVVTAPGFIAVANAESSWGGCATSYELIVFRARDGKRLLSLPLGAERETGGERCPPEPGRDRDVAAANRFLADLGFAPPAESELGAVSLDPERHVGKVYFAKAQLGLAQGEAPSATFRASGLRLLSGDRELARYAPVSATLSFARLLPASRAIVVGWERPGRDGCESVDPRGVVVLPLPAEKAP